MIFITEDFYRDACTTSAVMLANGSLESAILASAYADAARHSQEGSQLTLLSCPTEKEPDPATQYVTHLCETLQTRYPSLTVIQREVKLASSHFLSSNFEFRQNVAYFQQLVECACIYGQTLLVPLYDDGHFAGGTFPTEVIDTTNFWLESLSIQPLRIIAPFRCKTLQDIVRLGIELGVDLAKTFDCDEPVDQEPCLVCRRCIYRHHALAVVSAQSRDITTFTF